MNIIQQDLFEPSLYLQSGRDGYFTLGYKPYTDAQWKDHEYQLDLFNGTAALVPKKIRNWKQEHYRVGDLGIVIANVDTQRDSYISQAVFRRKSRRAIHVDHCALHFVDLDTYHLPNFDRLTQTEQIHEILSYIEGEEIPKPSLILFSGRGYQVKWILTKPAPHKALPRWNAVQRLLVNKLSGIGADQVAKDSSRVLRLEQTVNTKSGEISRVVYSSGREYSFDDFAHQILPIPRENITKRERIKIVQSGGRTDYNFQTLALARLSDLRRLRMLRQRTEDGFRSNHLFYEINFLLLSDITNRSQMYHEAKALCSEIDRGWWKDTNSELSTMYLKAQAMTKGEWGEYHGRKYPPLYTPKNSTLIDIFQIERDEMQHMSTIIDTEEKYRRKNKHRTEERRKAGSIPRAEYEANSISNKKPWEELGMSRAKWYRHGKPSLN